MSLAKSLFAAAISVVQMSAAVPVVVAVVVRMSAAVCMARSPSRKQFTCEDNIFSLFEFQRPNNSCFNQAYLLIRVLGLLVVLVVVHDT
jgi:hypothetical protein